MRHINQSAKKVMDKLVKNLNKPGDARVFDAHNYTKRWNGGIMAVHVQNIGNISSTGSGNLYSIAHYYKQNGDLMRDPEMIFLASQRINRKYELVDTYYPIYFRQDPYTEEESGIIEDGKITKYRPKIQAEHTKFANLWLQNIKKQQNL